MEARRHTREDLHRSAARSEGKQEHKQQAISQGEHEVPCEDPLTSVKTLSFGSYLVPTSCLEPSLNCESPGQLGQQGFKLLKLPGARRPQLGARLHNLARASTTFSKDVSWNKLWIQRNKLWIQRNKLWTTRTHARKHSTHLETVS